MKATVVGIIFFVLLGVGGFFGYRYFVKQSGSAVPSGAYKTEAVTLVGILRAAPAATDDYKHVLFSDGKSIGVTSYKIDLNQYLDQKVTVTGQYSGTTLYVDTIILAK